MPSKRRGKNCRLAIVVMLVVEAVAVEIVVVVMARLMAEVVVVLIVEVVSEVVVVLVGMVLLVYFTGGSVSAFSPVPFAFLKR